MMLTDLADACRKSGLKVVEVDGWRTRGRGPMVAVRTIVAHHTATSKAATGDYPSLRIVRDGRSDLPGPLAQLGLGRDGTVYVIAAGLSNHAGVTFNRDQSNAYAIGIEAEADGLSAWPPTQVEAYARLCAALCLHYGLPVSRVQGHKEVAAPLGRKSDPNFNMDQFRARVADVMQGDEMADYAKQLDQIQADAKAARVAAEKAAKEAERGRKGSYERDKKLIALARSTGGDVDALLAQLDGDKA